MKKNLLIFPVLFCLMMVLTGCPDPNLPVGKEIAVLCENAKMDTANADLVFEGANEDWTVAITLLDGVEIGEGKHTNYKGTITSFTEVTEELEIIDPAVYKFINDTTFKLVAKMKGLTDTYTITLKGIVAKNQGGEIDGKLIKIVCENATMDTLGSDLAFKGSNDEWIASITLLGGVTTGEGSYETYTGSAKPVMGISEGLQVKEAAVYKFINDSTFKVVATMKGAVDSYQITLQGVRRISSPTPEPPLSPDEQKNLLVNIGEQLIGTFNPADQKAAVELADDLYYKYKSYDWEDIGEQFENEIDEFYSKEFDAFFGMPSRVINMINGRQNASLKDLEILLILSKFGRLIEFDDSKKTVKITKTEDASIIAKFSDSDGVACELKAWGEGKEIEGSYTYEDGHWEYPEVWDEYWQQYVTDWENGTYINDGKRTIRVKVPTTIKMYLKHGSTSLVSMTFKWDSNLKDYVNTSLDLQVINMGFEEETRVNTTEASAVFSFTYGNKNMVTAAVNLPQYKLIGWEGDSDITEDEGYEWLEQYEKKYASLLGKLGRGEAKLDILGKVQLKGGITDGAALIDAYYNWEDKYYDYDYNTNYWWERPYRQSNAQEELCSIYDKYAYLSVYYNNTATEQAKLKVQPYEISGKDYEYNYETDTYEDVYYTYYDIEPVMFFPYNQAQIAVMTYFKSTKFLGLIDVVEELANSYVALDKHHLIFDEDFEVDLEVDLD